MLIEFVKRGDFFETRGKMAEAVCSTCGYVKQKKDGEAFVGVPAHAVGEAINMLLNPGHNLAIEKTN